MTSAEPAADVLASIEAMHAYYLPFFDEFGADDPATERWEELRGAYGAAVTRFIAAAQQELGLVTSDKG